MEQLIEEPYLLYFENLFEDSQIPLQDYIIQTDFGKAIELTEAEGDINIAAQSGNSILFKGFELFLTRDGDLYITGESESVRSYLRGIILIVKPLDPNISEQEIQKIDQFLNLFSAFVGEPRKKVNNYKSNYSSDELGLYNIWSFMPDHEDAVRRIILQYFTIISDKVMPGTDWS